VTPKKEVTATQKKTEPSKPAPRKQQEEQPRVLRVKDAYRGRPSNEKLIPVGLYIDGDERLQGIPDLLVQKGHAEWIQGLSAHDMIMLRREAQLPASQQPDGFRGMEPAEGQKEHGLMTPEQISLMNRPGYEPEPDRDEMGNTLPPAPDGFRGLVVNPDGTQARAGDEGDETEYAPEGQRPIIGTTNPDLRTPVAPVVPQPERARRTPGEPGVRPQGNSSDPDESDDE
jgi:hypothetical protein